MDYKFNMLITGLENRGFMSLEIPNLIRDIVSFLREEIPHSVSSLNRELEDLGWGINILDEYMYDLLISLMGWNMFVKQQQLLFASFNYAFNMKQDRRTRQLSTRSTSSAKSFEERYRAII